MTNYQGYFDASGHPDDQPFVVVAGFIATSEQWQAFEQPWMNALDAYQLRKPFHMTDFQTERRKDKGKVLDVLTDIINARTTAPFSSAVDMSGYRKWNDIYVLEEGVGTPYALATRGLARSINLWKARYFGPGDDLTLYVEEGTKHHGDMEEVFRRDVLPVPQKVPKSNPYVQPADLLAWEIHRFVRRHDNRRSLLKLHGSNTDYHGEFREMDILKLCKAANAPVRASLPPDAQHVFHSSPNRVRRRTIGP